MPTVLITGAGIGIGKASAEAFASEEAGRVYGGCKVVVLPSALAA